MQFLHDVALAPLTTFRLGGPAKRMVEATTEQEVVEAIRAVDEERGRLLVVGGGSNLVIGDAGFDGTVIRIATRGIERAGDLVTARAGENWDDFVRTMVGEGRVGVECLAGIPGLVGAVPMQNVGAYGQDVSETLVRLRAWDRDAKAIVTIERSACAFAYRSSAFRGKDRHVILDVAFSLPHGTQSRPIRYAELVRALGVRDGESAPLAAVREKVIALRRGKGMVLDATDLDTRSAGSFFTNPILSAVELAALRERAAAHAPMPVFPEPDGRSKVSAGWLIERAGFAKGFALPGSRVAVSSKHALALTNRGDATTEELIALARHIRAGVFERFGVALENEPVFVGVSL